MKIPWKTLSSKTILKNLWFSVRHDKVIKPDGTKGEYNVIMRPVPTIAIVALTNKGEVYLIKQFRYPLNKVIWELPAGGSDGQPLLKAAKRELWEETGLVAKTWKKVGSFYSEKGLSNDLIYVFLAQDLLQSGENEQKEEGIMEMKKIKLSKFWKMVRDGEIQDGVSIAALTQACLYLGKIK